ncbi:hypothetical protein RE6C_03610 [Rhodopirellula europaea 6C]|uniref:Uncharacterized protein n=1 Tax=Rhodopirellula europaea 6C TaxID=1263867 RepID=M2B098_9BACT|nr:hypothetical protein RE6C_03610 [Rhodopirellula europaea 6C]
MLDVLFHSRGLLILVWFGLVAMRDECESSRSVPSGSHESDAGWPIRRPPANQ